MAKLQITLDGELLDEYRLTRGRVTIGRRRNCDIVLDSPVVSGDHALIERIGTEGKIAIMSYVAGAGSEIGRVGGAEGGRIAVTA